MHPNLSGNVNIIPSVHFDCYIDDIKQTKEKKSTEGASSKLFLQVRVSIRNTTYKGRLKISH
jgi:hypothetical protein